MDSCRKFIFNVNASTICLRQAYCIYTRIMRMNITQTLSKLWTKLSCVYKYNLFKVTVCPQLWTYPYMISRQLRWDVHNFGQKYITPVRLRCPLLWTKNPMCIHITPVRMGCPLLWTKNLVHKHITPVRLGCPLLWTKNPMCIHITPVRLGCPPLWTKKNHTQTCRAS